MAPAWDPIDTLEQLQLQSSGFLSSLQRPWNMVFNMKHQFAALLSTSLALLSGTTVHAQQDGSTEFFRYNFTSNPVANPKSIVSGNGTDGSYRFTVLTDRLIRYEWSADGGFEDRASSAVPWRYFDTPDFKVVDEDGSLEIITDYFHLHYDKKNFTSNGLSADIANDTWQWNGESYGDLGGTIRTLDQVNGRTDVDPGVLSRNKPYSILDDSASMLFGKDGWIGIREDDRKDGYLFAYNRDFKATMNDFFRLSGDQPMLPRFVLGNWWSRYHAYSDKDYLSLMDHFKADGIPLTVGIVDMDWHLTTIPEKYGSSWTGYTWNDTLFSDPEGFIQELHNRGLKTSLNDHPADGVRAFEDPYEAMMKALDRDPSTGDAIEFDVTSRSFMDAYFDTLKAGFEDMGIDFWWVDWQQGTESNLPGVDPLWPLNHYHYLASQRQLANIRAPMAFSRFGGPGSQRYPLGFSGDSVVTWESLNFQPEFTATSSNIGYGWWSHDIGGHFGGIRSNELATRWVQLGCFSPMLRLHSSSSQWSSKAPWNFEPAAHAAMKSAMILRHRMVPFLYTMNYRAHFDREPLVQPLYWVYGNDSQAYEHPNEYFYGPDLIVAPITEEKSSTTLTASSTAWLPDADRRYIDILHPGLVYDGGRTLNFHRTLDEIPVFAGEGTILPLDATPISGKNGAANPTALEIQLVVGADATFTLVEEDESVPPSYPPERSDFIHTPMSWDQASGTFKIAPTHGGINGVGSSRNFTLRILGMDSLPASSPATVLSTTKGTKRSVLVSVGMVDPTKGAEVKLTADLQLGVTDMALEMYEVIYRAEMNYDAKDTVWELGAASNDDVDMRREKLMALDPEETSVDDTLKSAIEEVWFADRRSVKGGVVGFPEKDL